MSEATTSRRSVLAGLAVGGAAFGLPGLASPAFATPPPPALQNPLVRQRADAQVFRHDDGRYYMTASVPEYDRLIIRRSATLAGLGSAPETVIWRRPAAGKLGGYIWAPELHWFDGAWHMYFAAGDKDDPFRIRTYVLRGLGADPLIARWALLGQLETPWDSFTLDSTSFVHRGTRYLCWAQKEPGIDTNSNLYLAPLASPTILAAAPARLTVPTLDWEVQGFKVAEAPALLERNGRLFLTYSASATDARYCLGLLTANADADIMEPTSWTKSPVPVFTSSAETGVYGPGHNSFTVDEQGRDVLVYHGRDYEKIEGDPLFDPNRHTRVQRLYYRADGTPDFGIPVGNGPLPDRLSPLGRRQAFVRHDGDRLLVGGGAIAASQFRLVASGAGVTLQPITSGGRVVRVGDGGAVRLDRDDGSRAFAQRSRFEVRPGLADPAARSFVLGGRDGGYLAADGDRLAILRPGTPAERARATFTIS